MTTISRALTYEASGTMVGHDVSKTPKTGNTKLIGLLDVLHLYYHIGLGLPLTVEHK